MKLLILLATYVVTVLGTSIGGEIPLACNVNGNWGCDTFNIKDGSPDRLNCTESSKGQMPWALRPLRSPFYTLRAGDGASTADATSYSPGRIMDLFLFVNEYDHRYRGLLLYAEDANGRQVGEWKFSQPSGDTFFYSPWERDSMSPCQKVLVHNSARLKPFKSRFSFMGPPVGTGSITFKALIKQGDANTGAFFYPEADLSLTEGTAFGGSPYILGKAGLSCDAACNTLGKLCDEPELQKLEGEANFRQLALPTLVCRLPLMASCSNQDASKLADTGYCAYQDPTCPQYMNITTCAALPPSPDHQRFCACKDAPFSSAPATTTIPPPTSIVPSSAPPSSIDPSEVAPPLPSQTCNSTYPPTTDCSPNIANGNGVTQCVNGMLQCVVSSCNPGFVQRSDPTGVTCVRAATPSSHPLPSQPLPFPSSEVVAQPSLPEVACTNGAVLPCNHPNGRAQHICENSRWNPTCTPYECNAGYQLLGGACRPVSTCRSQKDCGVGSCVPVDPDKRDRYHCECPSYAELDRDREDQCYIPANVPNGTEPSSSATTSSLSMVTLVGAAIMGGRSSTMLVFAAAIVLLAVPSEAHNWINTFSRVPFAATTFPCMGKRSVLPHVQVAREQEFQIEWAVGHNSFTYLTLIRAKDAHKMELHTSRLLDDYIAKAPGGTNLNNQARYRKIRRTATVEGRYEDSNDNRINAASIYDHQISSSEGIWMERPEAFFTQRIRGPGFQWAYKSNEVARDAVHIYNSDTYPWIMGVWKYEHVLAVPIEVDVARFWIPGGEAGNYIVHYKWRGYYDCIDVNVLDQDPNTDPVQFVYGDRRSSFIASKVDHCMFRKLRPRREDPLQSILIEVIGNRGHEVCVNYCMNRATRYGCNGVNVFPYDLGWRNFGNHWTPGDNFITDMINMTFWVDNDFTGGEFDSNDRARESLQGDYETRRRAGEKFQVCHNVFSTTATSTEDKYVITDDVDDPVWYSTCYEISPEIYFIGFNATNDEYSIRHDFRHGEKCTSCETREMNSRNQVPLWVLTNKCIDCDRVQVTIPPMQGELIGDGYLCDAGTNTFNGGGMCTSNYCRKQWRSNLGGDHYGFQNEHRKFSPGFCYDLVMNEPECRKDFYFYQPNSYADYCWCLRDGDATGVDSCCNTINPPEAANRGYCVGSRSSNGAQLYSTRSEFAELAPNTPAHNCASGKLSTDSKYCCSGECSRECGYLYRSEGVMCKADSIPLTRPCSRFNPPCIMDETLIPSN